MAPFMLLMIDLFLMVVHGFVVFFNLTGWLWPAARVWHRWCVALTVASWFAVGWLHGKAGDCILTDWLWAVKQARGETHLPPTYIDYVLQMVGFNINPVTVGHLTLIIFAAVAGLTVWLSFYDISNGKRHLQDERARKRKEQLKPIEARKPLEKRARDR